MGRGAKWGFGLAIAVALLGAAPANASIAVVVVGHELIAAGDNGPDYMQVYCGSDGVPRVSGAAPGNEQAPCKAVHDVTLYGNGGADTFDLRLLDSRFGQFLPPGIGTTFGGGALAFASGGTGSDRVLSGRHLFALSFDGGPGPDRLQGGRERDFAFAGAGRDQLTGAGGEDVFIGGASSDRLLGGAGRDQLFGWFGKDLIRGGAGRDLLSGGKHRDRLFGGPGHDQLWGGRGHDLLRGGAGRDERHQKGGPALPGNVSIVNSPGRTLSAARAAPWSGPLP